LGAETLVELARHPRIRSLKEATGDVGLTSEFMDRLSEAGVSLTILSGDDGTWMPLMAVGASGVVSVASNVIPRAMVELYEAMERGNVTAARRIHQRWYPLFRDLFVETNPVPIKASMKFVGLCGTTVRAPLCQLSAKSTEVLQKTLHRCGLEKGARS
jgi:4-hydroxy-tetrahydrodipicolinate synthase